MSYVVNGEELETGEEDFLLEANFSDDVPPVIAAAEKITLTDEHWQVINYLREKYKEDGQTPNFRNMLAEIQELHPGTDWKKKLYELFPNMPARQGCRSIHIEQQLLPLLHRCKRLHLQLSDLPLAQLQPLLDIQDIIGGERYDKSRKDRVHQHRAFPVHQYPSCSRTSCLG